MKKTTILTVLLFLVGQHMLTNAQTPVCDWARTAAGKAYLYGGATDNSGNEYIIGYYTTNSINFGGHVLTQDSITNNNMFFVKYDSSGNVLWAKQSRAVGTSVCTDVAGNVYISGVFYDSMSLDGTSLITDGMGSVFIAKYNNLGGLLWAKVTEQGDPLVSSGGELPFMHTNAAGTALYMAGQYSEDTLMFGAVALINPNGSSHENIFLVKFDSSGNAMWGRSSNSSGATSFYPSLATGLVTDASDGVYITGLIGFDTISLGSVTPLSGMKNGSFIAKFDSSGNALWQAGGSNTTGGFYSTSIAVDASGNSFLAGGFYAPGGISLGSGVTLPEFAGSAPFLVKYDAGGSPVWASTPSGPFLSGASVANSSVLVSGNKIIVGGTYGISDLIFGLDTITNTASTTSDIFVAAYDEGGNALWAKSYGGNLNEGIWNANVSSPILSMDAAGNLYLASDYTSASITFNSSTITNASGRPNVLATKFRALESAGLNHLNNLASECAIYPNPARNIFTIRTDKSVDKGTLTLFNALGEDVYTTEYNGMTQVINYHGIPGLFYIQLVTSDNVYRTQIVITE